jgi:hypothetical protein
LADYVQKKPFENKTFFVQKLVGEGPFYEGKSAASFCCQVAALVPDMFCI